MKNLFLLAFLVITSCNNVVNIPQNEENSIELTYEEFLSIANESHRELTEKEVIDIDETRQLLGMASPAVPLSEGPTTS